MICGQQYLEEDTCTLCCNCSRWKASSARAGPVLLLQSGCQDNAYAEMSLERSRTACISMMRSLFHRPSRFLCRIDDTPSTSEESAEAKRVRCVSELTTSFPEVNQSRSFRTNFTALLKNLSSGLPFCSSSFINTQLLCFGCPRPRELARHSF